jgi:site-specific recombinase XerD
MLRLPRTTRAFLRKRPWTKGVVYRFHRWMNERELTIEALAPADVDAFLERPFRNPITEKTRSQYRASLRRYLGWMHAKGQTDWQPLARPNELPRSARRFLDSHPDKRKDIERIVRFFHSWLTRHQLAVLTLTPTDIEHFLDRPWRATLTTVSRRSYRGHLMPYLEWLRSRKRLTFDPEYLRLHPQRLPEVAQEFIASLRPTLRPGTCQGYATSLRKLHSWLSVRNVPLPGLHRRHTSEWMKALHDQGLQPATRKHLLIDARTYLRWLHERGELHADPDDLVRRSDMPKLPSYLPRPFPPDADLALQARLAECEDIHEQGLLLMRRTGLRVGELIALERNCVRTDHAGNRFLKVPLGKMHNERLVPLDEDTHTLIQRLQRRGRRNRSWLLTTASGAKTVYEPYRSALRRVCAGLELPDAVTTHRLRHTYATELLAGGMSLVGLMNLLGHRDYRMTLRYAAITQETVGKEYFEALTRIAARYRMETPAVQDFDPRRSVGDLIRWIKKKTTAKHRSSALIKRLRRLQDDLRDLDRKP